MSLSKIFGLFSLLMIGIGSGNIALADYSIPVKHTHNDREHNHQLPKEGVYHRHGIGQLGKPLNIQNKSTQNNNAQNKVIYSSTKTIPNKSSTTPSYTTNTTYKPPKPNTQTDRRGAADKNAHTHAGREHSHPLPNQGFYHRHGENSQIGQRIVRHTSSNTVVYNDTRNFPKLDDRMPTSSNNSNSYNNSTTKKSDNNRAVFNQDRTNQQSSRQARYLAKFTKGDVRCAYGQVDCNMCAANVKQQFQRAASKKLRWSRKRWDFTWPQAYPPQNVRPLDIFDGDPKYVLGIPDTHVQGFVRTNSRLYPYAGSHSHKKTGGIFVVKQGTNGKLFLSSLHKTTGRHPSGVQVIGRYLIYGEGTRLYFKDMNSVNQDNDIRLTAPKAQFGGGLGIVKLSTDNYLLITTGPGGQKPKPRFNRFYHLKMSRGRPVSLNFINESTTKKPQPWPAKLAYSENMSLITECGTGDVYAIHTTGDEQGLSAISGKGYWRLTKLVSNGKALGLTAVNAFTSQQDMKRCNVRASATVNVDPQKRLEFVCHGYAKDPDGSGFNVLGKASRNKDKFYFNVGTVN